MHWSFSIRPGNILKNNSMQIILAKMVYVLWFFCFDVHSLHSLFIYTYFVANNDSWQFIIRGNLSFVALLKSHHIISYPTIQVHWFPHNLNFLKLVELYHSNTIFYKNGRNFVLDKRTNYPIGERKCLFSFFSNSAYSSELGERLFGKFDKLAENINTRDDVILAHVNCDADSEFCDTNSVEGMTTGICMVFKLHLLIFHAPINSYRFGSVLLSRWQRTH